MVVINIMITIIMIESLWLGLLLLSFGRAVFWGDDDDDDQ